MSWLTRRLGRRTVSASPSRSEPKPVPVQDDSVSEEWVRDNTGGLAQVRHVYAARSAEPQRWAWEVALAFMPDVEPLASELERRMLAALGAVDGVIAVMHHDSETWVIEGAPSGSDLVRAASTVVDELAEDLEHWIRG